MSENTTIKYPTDNPLSFVRLSLPALSNMGALEVTGPILPNHQPRIAGVELVRERGAAETDPPTAVRYHAGAAGRTGWVRSGRGGGLHLWQL